METLDFIVFPRSEDQQWCCVRESINGYAQKCMCPKSKVSALLAPTTEKGCVCVCEGGGDSERIFAN